MNLWVVIFLASESRENCLQQKQQLKLLPRELHQCSVLMALRLNGEYAHNGSLFIPLLKVLLLWKLLQGMQDLLLLRRKRRTISTSSQCGRSNRLVDLHTDGNKLLALIFFLFFSC